MVTLAHHTQSRTRVARHRAAQTICYDWGMRLRPLAPRRFHTSSRGLRTACAAVSLLSLAASGCGSKEYVRGSDDPSVDHAAMGTGLDKVDIQKLLKACLDDLRVHPIMAEWRAAGRKNVTVAVFPFQNDTTEHIDSALAAILGEAEQWLIDGGTTVIDRQRQNQLIAEIEGSRNPVFNQANIPKYGKQLGVKYYLTGNVQAPTERTEDERRVQYFLFLRIVEVETSAIVWQHKAHVTKMVR